MKYKHSKDFKRYEAWKTDTQISLSITFSSILLSTVWQEYMEMRNSFQ